MKKRNHETANLGTKANGTTQKKAKNNNSEPIISAPPATQLAFTQVCQFFFHLIFLNLETQNRSFLILMKLLLNIIKMLQLRIFNNQ